MFVAFSIFSYKLRALANDESMGLWVVAYMERVVHVCVALLLSTYDEYFLFYVPPKIIRFVRELCIEMDVPPGSCVNVRKMFHMVDIIDSTRCRELPDVWRVKTILFIDYHPLPAYRGADYVSYDPWRTKKIDRQNA